MDVPLDKLIEQETLYLGMLSRPCAWVTTSYA